MPLIMSELKNTFLKDLFTLVTVWSAFVTKRVAGCLGVFGYLLLFVWWSLPPQKVKELFADTTFSLFAKKYIADSCLNFKWLGKEPNKPEILNKSKIVTSPIKPSVTKYVS